MTDGYSEYARRASKDHYDRHQRVVALRQAYGGSRPPGRPRFQPRHGWLGFRRDMVLAYTHAREERGSAAVGVSLENFCTVMGHHIPPDPSNFVSWVRAKLKPLDLPDETLVVQLQCEDGFVRVGWYLAEDPSKDNP